MSIANRIGSSLLPFTNPRVVCPPGRPGHHGRRNIVVATAMRSGTHLMIDLILNNLADYRVRPLYVDLDQCRKQSTPHRDLLGAIHVRAGQVIKTHLPIGVDTSGGLDPALQRIIGEAVVVTVRRDDDAVLRSLARWQRSAESLDRHRHDLDEFRSFWADRADVAVRFDDLFDPASMTRVLAKIAAVTGAHQRTRLIMPPSTKHPRRIYLNKAMTRVAGRHALRVDTTIHTLKV